MKKDSNDKKDKKKTKDIEEENTNETKSHIFIKLFMFIIIIICSVYLYAKYVGIKGLIVKEYRINSEILSNNFDGLKIIHFSDTLYNSTFDLNDFKDLVNNINKLKPDIIVFTGDLTLNNKVSNDDKEKIISYLSDMTASIGKYAIKGENDYSYSEYEYVMEKSDFVLLDNSYEEIYYKDSNPMYIVGLPSSDKEQVNLSESFKFYNEENRKYIICLAHDGKTISYLDDSTYEVDLILGGHSLNGSIDAPYYGALFLDDLSSKYYSEHYEKGITNIYISSGLGTRKYHYRLNNKPSFNLYRLKAQK